VTSRRGVADQVVATGCGPIGDEAPPLISARCAQVLGAFVAFALDQPQAQPLKAAR